MAGEEREEVGVAEGRQKFAGVEGGVGGDEVAGGGEDAGEGFGGHSGGAEGGEAGVAVAFGEAAAVGTDDEGDVDKTGRCQPEGVVEKELVVGGIEKVVATQDFGNPHGGIVHDDGEGVARPIGGTGDDEITLNRTFLPPVKPIHKSGRLATGTKPPCGEAIKSSGDVPVAVMSIF